MNPLLCQLSYAATAAGEDTNPTGDDKVGSTHEAADPGGKKTAGASAQKRPPRGRVCAASAASSRGTRPLSNWCARREYAVKPPETRVGRWTGRLEIGQRAERRSAVA